MRGGRHRSSPDLGPHVGRFHGTVFSFSLRGVGGTRARKCVLVLCAGGREVRIRSLDRRVSLLHAPISHDRLLGRLERKVGFGQGDFWHSKKKCNTLRTDPSSFCFYFLGGNGRERTPLFFGRSAIVFLIQQQAIHRLRRSKHRKMLLGRTTFVHRWKVEQAACQRKHSVRQ